MKIVLDTNVLVSGIFWTGVPYKILEYWSHGCFDLLVTEDILKEFERTLFKLSKGKNAQLVSNWLNLIAENSLLVSVGKKYRLSNDPDDDKFIDCAIAGKALYIISGDADLLDIGMVMGISIIGPSEFIRKIRGQVKQ